jgi:large subunit ribosomal protein L15
VDQHTLRPPRGAKRRRKRVGRGNASGRGTYSTRGSKGQRQRGSVPLGFEGGQIPLVRRLAQLRGFRNFSRVEYQAVNLDDIAERFEAGATVDGEALAAARLIDDPGEPYKVLARGELAHALTVTAPRLSASAKEAITAAGGSFEELSPAVKKVRNRIHRRRAAEEAAGASAAADGAESDNGGESEE